jgi:hypothetical protein
MNPYQNGRDEMREQIVSLIAHHMHTARVYHGKNSEEHMRYKNLITEIRDDHENELITRLNHPND